MFTGVLLANDLQKGMIDRFRSLPMSQSSVLTGRTLTDAARQGSESAALAIEVFAYRAAKAVGGLAVALGQIDVLVFTGGIGEQAPQVRSAILGHLGVLGLHEDTDANTEHGRTTGGRISLVDDDRVALVVPTDEELVIARDTRELEP